MPFPVQCAFLVCEKHWLVQDLERLCNMAVSQTDKMLKQCAQEAVSEDLDALGITQSPERDRQAQRVAHACTAAAFAAARDTQCNLCLAKTLSWARDQAAIALCKSSASQCELSNIHRFLRNLKCLLHLQRAVQLKLRRFTFIQAGCMRKGADEFRYN